MLQFAAFATRAGELERTAKLFEMPPVDTAPVAAVGKALEATQLKWRLLAELQESTAAWMHSEVRCSGLGSSHQTCAPLVHRVEKTRVAWARLRMLFICVHCACNTRPLHYRLLLWCQHGLSKTVCPSPCTVRSWPW